MNDTKLVLAHIGRDYSKDDIGDVKPVSLKPDNAFEIILNQNFYIEEGKMICTESL